MAWCLVKHRDNFTFTFYIYICIYVRILYVCVAQPFRYIGGEVINTLPIIDLHLPYIPCAPFLKGWNIFLCQFAVQNPEEQLRK
jgi:hypothetical protein